VQSLGSNKWISHADELKGLLKFIDDKSFQERWHQIKQDNKQRLADKIKVGSSFPKSVIRELPLSDCALHLAWERSECIRIESA